MWHRRLTLTLAFILPVASSFAQSTGEATNLDHHVSAADLSKDADVLVTTLTALHPGLFRYNSPESFAKHVGELRDELTHVDSTGGAYLAFSRFTATIQCSHTYANFSNQPKDVRESVIESGPRLPFLFRWIDGKMIVTKSLAGDFPAAFGDEVVAINSVSARALLDQLLQVARADGANNEARIAGLELQGHDKVEAFDVFLPLILPSVNQNLEIEIADAKSGSIRLTRPKPLTYADRQKIIEKPSVDQALWRLEYRSADLAVLSMPTWAVFNSKWDWKGFLQDTFNDLDVHKPANLVIDLRGNEGGLDVGTVLLQHLIEREAKTAASLRLVRYRRVPDELKTNLTTWDPSFFDWQEKAVPYEKGFFQLNDSDGQSNAIHPQLPRFAGHTFVLMGARNSSATYQFVSRLKELGIATLVGQTSGGNQQGINGGAFFFLKLPNSHIEIDVPLIYQGKSLDGTGIPNGGIAPDVAVHVESKDIQQGADPELNAVLRSLTTQTKDTSKVQ